MQDLSIKEAEKLLSGIIIPPRPNAVASVMEQSSRSEPDLKKLAQTISTDVALTAAVLKTINSPLYGLRQQTTSISHAVTLLGIKNVTSLVVGLSLRTAVPAAGLARFWDSASRAALVSAYLARTLGIADRESAYLYGLFHDCGIPLMMQRFSDYKETLALASNDSTKSIIQIENERHATNHALVGSLLASNWRLPELLRDAIRNHHEPNIFQSELSKPTLNLIAIGKLSEFIENSTARLSGGADWDNIGHDVLSQLMIYVTDLDEIQRDCQELLAESGL